jgi:hypothetical protein
MLVHKVLQNPVKKLSKIQIKIYIKAKRIVYKQTSKKVEKQAKSWFFKTLIRLPKRRGMKKIKTSYA